MEEIVHAVGDADGRRVPHLLKERGQGLDGLRDPAGEYGLGDVVYPVANLPPDEDAQVGQPLEVVEDGAAGNAEPPRDLPHGDLPSLVQEQEQDLHPYGPLGLTFAQEKSLKEVWVVYLKNLRA